MFRLLDRGKMNSVIFAKKKVIRFFKRHNVFRLPAVIILPVMIFCQSCRGEQKSGNISVVQEDEGGNAKVNSIEVLPLHPAPGQYFRIVAAGGKDLTKARVEINGPSGNISPVKERSGGDDPFWRVDSFEGLSAGKYTSKLTRKGRVIGSLDFEVTKRPAINNAGVVWKSINGWNSGMEVLYSAWISALFQGCDESMTWTALHQVTRDSTRNFLYNSLSLGEDKAVGREIVIMQPDCADNPFFLRAYFSWKLGLPFGFHLCSRGYLHHSPETGQWVTNESSTAQTGIVLAFNAFLRKVADGVHSGTARTSLTDENSDYYPVPLERRDLRPGTVYADPYGHTLILTGWMQQASGKPGMLLSVDAQPDGTVGIKRFWKGNFLFNTAEVVGEPGFKAFRPVSLKNGNFLPFKNKSLTAGSGFVPFSLQQRKMDDNVFYHTMDRLINPESLDPESAMLDQITALHEQLQVRVISVGNGEKYMSSHPGAVIPMPSSATGIFLAGGQWEDFSTPNRDLRLLIAIDAVEGFPDKVAGSPHEYKVRDSETPEHIKERLKSILEKKAGELTISYIRSDGSEQKLTLADIMARKDAFEVAYNPNDGIEIRWGAPENSREHSACRRHAPANQGETMRSVRSWFHKRLHPPT